MLICSFVMNAAIELQLRLEVKNCLNFLFVYYSYGGTGQVSFLNPFLICAVIQAKSSNWEETGSGIKFDTFVTRSIECVIEDPMAKLEVVPPKDFE